MDCNKLGCGLWIFHNLIEIHCVCLVRVYPSFSIVSSADWVGYKLSTGAQIMDFRNYNWNTIQNSMWWIFSAVRLWLSHVLEYLSIKIFAKVNMNMYQSYLRLIFWTMCWWKFVSSILRFAWEAWVAQS